MAISNKDIELEAINIVQGEVEAYEDAQVFVTERVAFAMRDLIRTLRKNYWGVFDSPKDPLTGRDKVWVPLSRQVADTARKNIDLDTKDINFRSKDRTGIASTDIVRAGVRDYLDRTFFGDMLNTTATQLCIDGTSVWKSWEEKEDGKVMLRTKQVDLMNVYIDPSAESIQKAYRFTERALMDKSAVQSMSGWMNTDEVEAQTGMSNTDTILNTSNVFNTSKMVEVFETWGKIPLWLITGKESDKKAKTEVDGHIVVSNARKGKSPKLHLVERNTTTDKDNKIIKPYEEVWYSKVAGRWYGVGPVEMVIPLQTWVNTVDNIRINRNYVSQLGLFKVRSGAGITRDSLSRLGSNGVIKVQNMDDIQQMVIQEATQSSYNDETVAVDWARQITGATETVIGERLPSSSTATSAVIQDRNSKSTFALVREGFGIFLQRWMDRHALPVILKGLRKGNKVRIPADFDNIRQLRDRVALYLVQEQLNERIENGDIPTELQIQEAIEDTLQKLESEQDLFVTLTDNILANGYDTKIYVTNEEFDPAVTADKIISMMQIAPELRGVLVPRLTDILGLEMTPAEFQNAQQVQGQQRVPTGVENPIPKTEQELVTGANTL